MKQLKNVHKPVFSPWDTLDSPFHWGFSSSPLDCQTFLPLPLWNGNTKLSTLKKKTHLKHLNNSLLTKPDDKGNSLLYEGNLSPAYDQNIHFRANFLTECHGPPIVSRIRRHLGMMQSSGRKNVMSMRELFCPDPLAGLEKMAGFQIFYCLKIKCFHS